jgi:hypothetical protein
MKDQHIISVDNKDVAGIGYAAKIHSHIFKKYGIAPLVNHYNCAMAMAGADLEIGDIKMIEVLNTSLLRAKGHGLPGYAEVFIRLRHLYDKARVNSLQKTDAPKMTKEGPAPEFDEGASGFASKKQAVKLAYMLGGAVYTFCKTHKIDREGVVRALCALADLYEETGNVV